MESGKEITPIALDVEAPSHWILAMSSDGQLMAVSDPTKRHLRIYAHDTARMAAFAAHKVRRKLTDAECLLYLRQEKCLPMD